MEARGDEPRNVGDIDHHQSPRFVANFADARKVDDAGIGARTRDDHLRLAGKGDLLHLVVVEDFRLCRNAVRDDIEVGARDVGGRTVRQVPAVGEVHAHDGIAGL